MATIFKALILLVSSIVIPTALANDAISSEVSSIAKHIGKEVFSDVERQVLEGYMARRGIEKNAYRDRDDKRDRDGKQKKHKGNNKHHKKAKGDLKSLPPGIRKNLARGSQIPPGIARTRLPEDVESRLPPAKKGYQRYVSDDRVLLVEEATGVITDLISDVKADNESLKHSNRRAEERPSNGASTPAGDDVDSRHQRGKEVGLAASSADTKDKKSWWQFWK